MEGESRELSDAGVGGRRVGRDGAQGQGLAPGGGAGGDAVVDGSTEELLETVVGFEVEVLFRRLFRERLTGYFDGSGAGISHIVPVVPDGSVGHGQAMA